MWHRAEPDPTPRLAPAVLVAYPTAYALGAFATIALVGIGPVGVGTVALAIPVAGLVLGGTALTVLAMVRPWARRWIVVAGEVVLLGVLPAWGYAINDKLPSCEPCGDVDQALAWPGVLAVYALYLAGLAAYVASRLRPEPLRVPAEAALQALLWLGVGTCSALALQFGASMALAVVYAPIGLPLVAPPIVSMLWAWVAYHRGARAVRSAAIAGGAAATVTVADAVLHLALTSKLGLFGATFTGTCGWTMSQLVKPEGDCHYLCTVAAQGHPWLVRPLRLGRRHGRPIVVNRQLAVANAFEDLIHERWPTVGRVLRRTYDRVGLPISAWLLHPLAADAVYLAMLPAQLGFELFLQALDREPEARIDRMYR